jgi:transposase-like protein
VITVAVRWSLRYGLSYRDLEELLAERGIAVDHVTMHRPGAEQTFYLRAHRRGPAGPPRDHGSMVGLLHELLTGST